MTQDLPTDGEVSYDPSTEAYITHHHWSDDGTLFYSILTAVEAVTGDCPTEMKPMSNVLDIDALAQMFSSTWNDEQKLEEGHIKFTYHGCEITVTAEGKIEIQTE